MSSVFSVLAGIVLLITSVMLLDALRKEQETAFKGKYGDEIRTNVMPGLAKEKVQNSAQLFDYSQVGST